MSEYKLRDLVLAEVKKQGLTAYRIAKITGINTAVIARFLSGERDIMGINLSILVEKLKIKI